MLWQGSCEHGEGIAAAFTGCMRIRARYGVGRLCPVGTGGSPISKEAAFAETSRYVLWLLRVFQWGPTLWSGPKNLNTGAQFLEKE